MEPEESTWNGVRAGLYLLDRDGQTIWKVAAERPGQVLLEGKDGTRKVVLRPDGGTPVTLMFRTMEEVEAMLQERLGATLLARGEAKHFDCPLINPKDGGALRTHLFMFHGTYVGDVKMTKGLIACHDEQHEEVDAGHTLQAYVLHRHTNVRPLGRTA